MPYNSFVNSNCLCFREKNHYYNTSVVGYVHEDTFLIYMLWLQVPLVNFIVYECLKDFSLKEILSAKKRVWVCSIYSCFIDFYFLRENDGLPPGALFFLLLSHLFLGHPNIALEWYTIPKLPAVKTWGETFFSQRRKDRINYVCVIVFILYRITKSIVVYFIWWISKNTPKLFIFSKKTFSLFFFFFWSISKVHNWFLDSEKNPEKLCVVEGQM